MGQTGSVVATHAHSAYTLSASKFTSTTRALFYLPTLLDFLYWGNSVVDRKVSFKEQLCL